MTSVSDTRGIEIIRPEWPAPRSVHAAFTLRMGGTSAAPFDTLNVGLHVGDDAEAVAENRRRLQAELHLPADPSWMEQVHGTEVLDLDAAPEVHTGSGIRRADAAVTRRTGHVCVVQVADCLPVLLAARDGAAIAAAHAGWRGLMAGVLEATVRKLAVEPARLIAWLGPGIGSAHFEVGEEVRRAFLAHDTAADAAFTANVRGRWQCDLVGLARARLTALGVTGIFGGGWCTYADAARFFSYRRDGRCGRMAALIWREK